MAKKRYIDGTAYGDGDAIKRALDATQEHPQITRELSTQEALALILVELRILNAQMATLTGDAIKPGDVGS